MVGAAGNNVRAMNAHPALARLLRQVADAGGKLQYVEGQSPFSDDVLLEAADRGWLRIGADGGQGAMEILTLTDAGREAAGMSPQFDLIGWLRRRAMRR